jgi:hypothetical protein
MLKCLLLLASHLPVLSLNPKTQHDDPDHDLESSPDQSTQANDSDQTRCCHDIQLNSIMISNTSTGPSASSVETARVELTTTINSPSFSTSTQTSTQENLANENQPFHLIIETLRQQELGRHVLILAVPMTIGLFSVDKLVNEPLALRVMAIALALGFVGIWNGILLRTTCNEASNIIELLGIAFMLLAFFGFIACFLPESLIWIPYLCWVLSLLPFVIALCSTGRATKDRDSNDRQPRPHSCGV